MAWQDVLDDFDDTPAGVSPWAGSHADPVAAWRACDRADWMLWLLARSGADRRTLILVLCDLLEAQGSGTRRVRMARGWASGTVPVSEALRTLGGPLGEIVTLAHLFRQAQGRSVARCVLRVFDPLEPTPAGADRVRRQRWPRHPRTELQRCRPALRVAWDWVADRTLRGDLSTLEALVAVSVRHRLLSLPVGLNDRERDVVRSLAEALATAADRPARMARIEALLLEDPL